VSVRNSRETDVKQERAGRSLRAFAAATLAATAVAPAVTAQDFLFRRPSVTVGARIGYSLPSAGGEIFDFTREQLTISTSDFNALALGGEIAVRTTDRIDLALAFGYAGSKTRSEFREFVGTDDLPIEQETRFSRVPLTLGAKVYLSQRGRRISELAWIPRKWAPYVGGGAGIVWYRFQQEGEFVDFETLDIFFDEFVSKGSSALGYATAGVDYSLTPKWLVNGEARYAFASAAVSGDFVGFEDIDLSGFTAALGISLRF
jgi:outer membrane protein W